MLKGGFDAEVGVPLRLDASDAGDALDAGGALDAGDTTDLAVKNLDDPIDMQSDDLEYAESTLFKGDRALGGRMLATLGVKVDVSREIYEDWDCRTLLESEDPASLSMLLGSSPVNLQVTADSSIESVFFFLFRLPRREPFLLKNGISSCYCQQISGCWLSGLKQ